MCSRAPLAICSKRKVEKKKSSSLLTEYRREALLLCHRSMCSGVVDERFHVGLDHLAAAVRALCGMSAVCSCTGWWTDGCRPLVFKRTMTVSLGGLTGRPLALTGARVPARSAFLCSRWIWKGQHWGTRVGAQQQQQ